MFPLLQLLLLIHEFSGDHILLSIFTTIFNSNFNSELEYKGGLKSLRHGIVIFFLHWYEIIFEQTVQNENLTWFIKVNWKTGKHIRPKFEMTSSLA